MLNHSSSIDFEEEDLNGEGFLEKSSDKSYRQIHLELSDLAKANPLIYWVDLFLSTLIGWVSFVLVIRGNQSLLVTLFLFTLTIFALYRSILFIHEIAHLKKGAVPGFQTAWNLLVGIPLLIPSFFYTGVHLYHHRRAVYGTAEDPEYLSLAHQSFWQVISFLLIPLLAPIGLILRFFILAPLSLVSSKVYRFTVAKCSTLGINPAFSRAVPQGKEKKNWILLEIACFLWISFLLASIYTGFFSWKVLAFGVLTGSLIGFINQLRTLVAHRFQNEGVQLTVEEQLLDSVNFPNGLLVGFWAPLGLRYHALHHYFPSFPYHSLKKAHERLVKILPSYHEYSQVNATGFFNALKSMFETKKP